MDTNKNYYETLGITPSAELAVIKAVYKALANKHHPDKNIGNAAQAEAKMREINEAYEVLSDSVKRAAYDAARNKADEAVFEETDDTLRNAEDTLSKTINDNWTTAEKYFPDLHSEVERLSKVSSSLVIPFKIYLIEEQAFSNANSIATSMIRKYLETYFGKNELVQDYALQLLADEDIAAAKELNKLVRLFGKEMDLQHVAHSINIEFNTKINERNIEAQKRRAVDNDMSERYGGLIAVITAIILIAIFTYPFLN